MPQTMQEYISASPLPYTTRYRTHMEPDEDFVDNLCEPLDVGDLISEAPNGTTSYRTQMNATSTQLNKQPIKRELSRNRDVKSNHLSTVPGEHQSKNGENILMLLCTEYY